MTSGVSRDVSVKGHVSRLELFQSRPTSTTSTLHFERRGNHPCLISLVKAIRACVRNLSTPWRAPARIIFFIKPPKVQAVCQTGWGKAQTGGLPRPSIPGPCPPQKHLRKPKRGNWPFLTTYCGVKILKIHHIVVYYSSTLCSFRSRL